MNASFLFALIPFFTWALGDFFGTLASRKNGNIPTNMGFLLFSFLLLTCFVPWAGPIHDSQFFLLAILLGGIHVLGLLSYFRALEIGKASVVGAIAGSFSVVIVVLSVLVFHESLRLTQSIAVLFCFLGLFLSTFPSDIEKHGPKRAFRIEPSILLALCTLLAWGIYFTFIRIPVEHIGWFWSLYPATFYFLPLLFLPFIRRRLQQRNIHGNTLVLILLLTVFGRIGDFAYNMALTKGPSSLLGAIAGSSPVFFVVLCSLFIKDTLTARQKTGIFFTLLGIIGIAFL